MLGRLMPVAPGGVGVCGWPPESPLDELLLELDDGVLGLADMLPIASLRVPEALSIEPVPPKAFASALDVDGAAEAIAAWYGVGGTPPFADVVELGFPLRPEVVVDVEARAPASEPVEPGLPAC
jgi:hypothetical protein